MIIGLVGSQHSGTRLFKTFLTLHPNISRVIHWSVPGGTPQGIIYDNFYDDFNKNKVDKIIVVSRDRSCINKSNWLKKKMRFVAEKSSDLIKQNLKRFEDDGRFNDIVFVSYEMLISYKEYTLKQMFRNLGLDFDGYDFNREGIIEFQWYKINLALKDGNAKYVK